MSILDIGEKLTFGHSRCALPDSSMPNELELLDQAMQYVRKEQSDLQTECDAFREFRNTVSRAQPATPADPNSGTGTAQLLEAYQETVMSTPDFGVVYSDSLTECIEAEFRPSVSNILLSGNPVTQKYKRDILLATNRAIKQRQLFYETLDAELESLRITRDTISSINETIKQFPPCSVQCRPFEDFLDVWEACETQLKRCDCLLQKRQESITEIQQLDVAPSHNSHSLNQYLYSDLETTYPALSAIAEARSDIKQHREKSKPKMGTN